jgi:hypothetical protein
VPLLEQHPSSVVHIVTIDDIIPQRNLSSKLRDLCFTLSSRARTLSNSLSPNLSESTRKLKDGILFFSEKEFVTEFGKKLLDKRRKLKSFMIDLNLNRKFSR